MPAIQEIRETGFFIKNEIDMDDEVSSLRVPYGIIVEMWEHPHEDGNRTVYRHTGECENLGASMNNQVSHIKITNAVAPY